MGFQPERIEADGAVRLVRSSLPAERCRLGRTAVGLRSMNRFRTGKLVAGFVGIALCLPSFCQSGDSRDSRGRKNSEVPIVLEGVPENDEALRVALDELHRALSVRHLYAARARNERDCSHCIVVKGQGALSDGQSLRGQSFDISPTDRGLEISSPGVGVVYGLFQLAEEIRRQGLNWQLHQSQIPAFRERIFSYEGTLLDLPDEGYYFRQPPYVNEPLLRQQVEQAKVAMRKLLAYRFNTVAFLNLNLEDYVNYDLLGNGNRVYAPDSLHRLRSAVFCRALSELADYAHRLHLQLFLQIYEMSFPDYLDGRGLSDHSSQTWEYVDARFRELFGRTTLDGIILTLTEPSPRLAYRGITLWTTPEGAGRMATHYYETIVQKMKRRLVMRLWLVADDLNYFNQVMAGAPNPEIVYDTKNTAGDFFLSLGENALIREGAPKLRPFSVTFDAFRQFDGWGELIFYPVFWGQRFRDVKSSGVVAVDAWGPWDAGCIYPGIWVGKYDQYDFLRHGFRPSLASLYLFARLAWQPDDSVESIAREWAALSFGKQNAAPIAQALSLSYNLWLKSYLGKDDQGVFKWTMIFQPLDPANTSFFMAHSLRELQDANAQAVALASRIHVLVYSVDTARAPDLRSVREFRRSADLTLLYFRTFTAWRELLWRNREWDGGRRSTQDRTELLRVIAELKSALPEWRRYPIEAKDWFVFKFDPEMNTAPDWLKRTSVADTIGKIQEKVEDGNRQAVLRESSMRHRLRGHSLRPGARCSR